jgi:hypothetical protein
MMKLSNSIHEGNSLIHARKAQSIPKVPAVNTRSYAKFTNGMWYWGVITKVNKNNNGITFGVRFDDGDTLAHVKWADLYTEDEYRVAEGSDGTVMESNNSCLPPAESTDADIELRLASMSLEDLRKNRCHNCLNCTKEDCQKCKPCRSNIEISSPRPKQVCLRKVRLLSNKLSVICDCFLM